MTANKPRRGGDTRLSILIREQITFDQKVWYERLNIANKLKRFCQSCAGSFWFWLVVGAFTLAEPILCTYFPVGAVLVAQIVVLGVSSVLYVIQLVGTASREWDKIVLIQAISSASNLVTVQDFTPLKILIFFTAEGEYILEFCCLLGGWLTIFTRPGLAILRCFRVFRLLWFCEVVVFKATMEHLCNPLFGAHFVSRCFKMMRFAIKALTALGNEMFRLTNATRGGLLLMMIFFYSAFVLGNCLWVETRGESSECNSRSHCTYTLMRLTFYDGDAFNFVYTLTTNHKFLFFLCIVYMCLTSFGILNGLVGIFGTAFAQASDDAFNDHANNDVDSEIDADDDEEVEDQRQMRSKRLASLVFRSFKNLNPDDNSGGGSGVVSPQPGSRRNSDVTQQKSQPFATRRKTSDAAAGAGVSPRTADYNLSNTNNTNNDHNQEQIYSDEEGVMSLDGQVWAYDDNDGEGSGDGGNADGLQDNQQEDQQDVRAACDQLPAADKTAMQKQLLGKLGGKSAFALQELKRIAEESNNNKHHTNNNQRPVGSIPTHYADTRGKVIPLNDNTAAGAAAGAEETMPQYKVLQSVNAQVSPPVALHKTIKGGHRNAPGGVGMFAQTRNTGSNKNLSHVHDPPSHRNPFAPKQAGGTTTNQGGGNPSNNNQTSGEIRALTLNVQALTRTVEVQNDMLIALYTQILALKRAAQDQQYSAFQHSGPGNSRSLSPAELQFPLMTPSPQMAANIARLDAATGSNAPSRDEPEQRQRGILPALHAVQHAVQDGIGHTLDKILHPSAYQHQRESPSAVDVSASDEAAVHGVYGKGAAGGSTEGAEWNPVGSAVDGDGQQQEHRGKPQLTVSTLALHAHTMTHTLTHTDTGTTAVMSPMAQQPDATSSDVP